MTVIVSFWVPDAMSLLTSFVFSTDTRAIGRCAFSNIGLHNSALLLCNTSGMNLHTSDRNVLMKWVAEKLTRNPLPSKIAIHPSPFDHQERRHNAPRLSQVSQWHIWNYLKIIYCVFTLIHRFGQDSAWRGPTFVPSFEERAIINSRHCFMTAHATFLNVMRWVQFCILSRCFKFILALSQYKCIFICSAQLRYWCSGSQCQLHKTQNLEASYGRYFGFKYIL